MFRWRRFVELVIVTLASAMVVSSCSSTGDTSSGASIRQSVVSKSIPGVRVGLTPILDGGNAGWCIALTDAYSSVRNNGAVCTGARPSTGPIFAVTCSGSSDGSEVIVLTKGEVAFVAVAGGTPIPTGSSSTLPGGLRAAVIELPGYRIVPKSFSRGYPWYPCPHVTPLNASDKPIDWLGKAGVPLVLRLPRGY